MIFVKNSTINENQNEKKKTDKNNCEATECLQRLFQLFQLSRTLWAKKKKEEEEEEPTHYYWPSLWQSKIQGFLCLAAFSFTEIIIYELKCKPHFDININNFLSIGHQMVINNALKSNHCPFELLTFFSAIDFWEFPLLIFKRLHYVCNNMPWVISAQCPMPNAQNERWTIIIISSIMKKIKEDKKNFTNRSIYLHTKSCKLNKRIT